MKEIAPKKKILLVDDVEINRAVMSEIFHRSYEIVEAENGRDAIELIKRENFSAVLLDIIMPETDGFEVLRFMKESSLSLRIPVFTFSSDSSVEMEKKCLNLGAADFVLRCTKPYFWLKRIERAIKIFQDENSTLVYDPVLGAVKR